MVRRRAVVLLLVLVSLTLAVALITPLVAISGTMALETGHQERTLRHRLAAESVVALLPQLLEQDRRLRLDLERTNRAQVEFALGEVHSTALIQDDTAKLPILLLDKVGQLRSSLERLQVEMGLPGALQAGSPPLEPDAPHDGAAILRWSGCLDDLFAGPRDADLFGTPTSVATWAQFVSPLGQRVHVFHAQPAVLAAALDSLESGLGRELARRREQYKEEDLGELLASLELTDQVHQEAARRLTTRCERYSLLIRTSLHGDVRQRYIICSAAVPPQVLLNWEVAP